MVKRAYLKRPRTDFLIQKYEKHHNPPPEPFSKRETFTCPRCYRLYKPEKLYQMYCSEDCENVVETKINQLKEERLNSECVKCGAYVRRCSEGKSLSVCQTCKYQYQYLHHKKLRENRVKEQEENPQASKRKKLSYEELIRREEYKRVWKDSGWTHYIKGRKWDRI